MIKYIKEYDLSTFTHCAVNCPFMRMEVLDGSKEADQTHVTPYCTRYEQRLFSEDENKLQRAKECTINKVEWCYHFDEE